MVWVMIDGYTRPVMRTQATAEEVRQALAEVGVNCEVSENIGGYVVKTEPTPIRTYIEGQPNKADPDPICIVDGCHHPAILGEHTFCMDHFVEVQRNEEKPFLAKIYAALEKMGIE